MVPVLQHKKQVSHNIIDLPKAATVILAYSFNFYDKIQQNLLNSIDTLSFFLKSWLLNLNKFS